VTEVAPDFGDVLARTGTGEDAALVLPKVLDGHPAWSSWSARATARATGRLTFSRPTRGPALIHDLRKLGLSHLAAVGDRADDASR
jgi:hypothetical protein